MISYTMYVYTSKPTSVIETSLTHRTIEIYEDLHCAALRYGKTASRSKLRIRALSQHVAPDNCVAMDRLTPMCPLLGNNRAPIVIVTMGAICA
jgi:hypothetical protein